MTSLITICETINNNSVAIINNLQQESIDVYKLIQNEYSKGDIRKNNIFKFAFRSFYKLDSAGLTPDIKNMFFELFEKNRTIKNPNMKDTLKELSEIKNFKEQSTVQFSFVTKMFHTIDNSMPIYDNEVITVFGFKQPYNIQDTDEKIDKYTQQYDEICKLYRLIEDNNLIKKAIEMFNQKFSRDILNQTITIDFIFWSAGKLIRQNKIRTSSHTAIISTQQTIGQTE